MEAGNYSLAQLLTLASLLAATIEYAEVMRRRAAGRRPSVDLATLQASALPGMVRVLVVDETG